MEEDRFLQWYAVHVRSRHEKKVHRSFLDKQLTSFLPLLETLKQWHDRKKKVYEPLLRGYVFVNIDIKHDHLKVLDTESVVRFVGIGSKPSAICGRDINWLKRLVKEPDAINQITAAIPAGRRVVVMAGPFKDFEGVVRKQGSEARLVVYFDSIMQGVEITISPDLLVPV